MNAISGKDSDNNIRNIEVSQTGEIYVATKGTSSFVSAAGNPSASVTRPADTTAYAANDVISTAAGANITFTTGMPTGSKLAIYSAIMRTTDAGVIAGMTSYRLHLYSSAPTAIADNAAHALVTADAAKYLGYITLSALEDRGDLLFKRSDGINAVMSLATGSATLYGQLQTVGAFTPTSGTVYTIELVMGAI
jgi:hypothetical protein